MSALFEQPEIHKILFISLFFFIDVRYSDYKLAAWSVSQTVPFLNVQNHLAEVVWVSNLLTKRMQVQSSGMVVKIAI